MGMTELDAVLELRRRLYRVLEGDGRACEAAGIGFVPALDVVAGENGMIMTVELPGVVREDVRVELEGCMLSISGERKTREGRYQRRERVCGRFERTLALPEGEWACAATLRDGVLTVRVKRVAA